MSVEPPPPAPSSPPRRSRPGLRQLDRRTVGISLLIALIAALATGLLVSVLTDDSGSDDRGSTALGLTPAAKVDTTKALDTRIVTFDGRATTLAALVRRGKPVVVNFFSSTCTPCVTEMPAFEKVHRGRRDLSFVGIDVQDQVGAGRKLIKRTGITYEALRDPPGDLLRTIGGVGLPTTVLIDPKTGVVATHTGALTERALESLISAKLAETAVIDAPIALAFTAGMVATVNPCGFAMLPAYLSYFLGIEGTDEGPTEAGVLRALVVGAVVSLGFVALFGVAGAFISWTSFSIERYASWVTIAIGAVLVGLGGAFLRGWEPRLGLPHLDKGGRDRGLWSMFVFGLSYAIASLSCAIGPFMTAVAGTFRRSNAVSGMVVFGAYALGMAVLLMALTLTLALARQSLLRGLRASLPYVQRVAGGIMVVTGAYLTWYGIYEIRVQEGSLGTGGPVDAVFSWSGDLQNWVSSTGAIRIGLVLGILASVAALVALIRMKPRDTADR